MSIGVVLICLFAAYVAVFGFLAAVIIYCAWKSPLE